jgi:hypothetical protein
LIELKPEYLIVLLAIPIIVIARVVLRARAADRYNSALNRLRSNPDDPTAIEEANDATLSYANYSQDQIDDRRNMRATLQNGVEIARLQGMQSSQGSGRATVEHRLKKLADLRSQGLITESDYSDRKQEILDEV